MVLLVNGENPNYDPSEWVNIPYSSYTWDINFLGLPVYRADSKEQYYTDFGSSVLRVGAAALTGGYSAASKAAWIELGKLLN